MNLQSIKPCNYSICIFSAWIVTTIGLRSLWDVGEMMKKILVVLIIIVMIFSLVGCKENNLKSDFKTVLTLDDAHVYSFNCGYLSIENRLNYMPIFIANEEQLKYAQERYGLAYKYDNGFPLKDVEKSVVDEFQKMIKSFPISEYNYLIQYDEFSCGGYDYHADRVIIEQDNIYFHYDKQIEPEDEYVPECMDGFYHMAAIKKEIVEDKVFSNVVYPDYNDINQSLGFRYAAYIGIEGTQLYECYGDKTYVLTSREEYDRFLNMAKGISLPENVSLDVDSGTDFDNVSVAVKFCRVDTSEWACCNVTNVTVQDGKVEFEYDISEIDPQKVIPSSCMMEAYIPKRFLEEK